MRLAGLGSGSAGNGILIAAGSSQPDSLPRADSTTTVLVDCGFTLKEAELRIARHGLDPAQLEAILVTHEHSDHVGGVERLARKYGLPIYLTRGTWLATRWSKPDALNFQFIEGYAAQQIGLLTVFPYAIPHDAREPAQYVFRYQDKQIGLLTDVGHYAPHLAQVLQALDGLLLECNHELALLDESSYPARLKQRIGGRFGHLSNCTAAAILRDIAHSGLQCVIAAHLSQENNRPALARAALEPVLAPLGLTDRLHIACQEQGFDWIKIQ
ncbi:MBL fold metallo-hydrolase [Parvibium lacunae]|uniref:MBL fold metallo-hydrolase n=1 Tax=Parvibium lacunae TaxID=1888893 RepID=A0A368L8F8_9BURK|nr:MBL fold metallo-hydrolase [Parvibium lacunae]RCS59933.1 MBL fold metallo-hydrolase [Parvibium lacunae]